MEEVQKQLNVEIEQDAFASQGNNKAQIRFGPGSPFAEDGLAVSWKYGDSSSSPCSAYPSVSEEDLERESKSSYSYSSLERSNLDASIEKNDDTLRKLEEFANYSSTRHRLKENRSISPTRRLHCGETKLVMEIGEEWWKRGLKRFNVPDLIIFESRNSVASTTWSSYTFGFAHFSLALEEEGYGDFSKEFSDWFQICANIFIKLRDKGFPYSCFCTTRSAVSLFTRICYGENLGQVPLIETLFRSFHRSHIPRKPYTSMWSPSIVFDYFNRMPPNEELSFFDLTVKCIILLIIFTACRFREMERISMNQSVIQEDSIHLFTNLKTSSTPSYITVPIMKCADEKRHIFLNTVEHTLLKTEGIRKLARLGMTQIGIPGEYRPYTLKNAANSALLSKGVPEAMVARHARMSPNSHTPTRSHFKANLASRMADTLLSTVDNRKPQSQMCLQDRNDYAQSAQTTSTNFPKASEGETIFPNKVEEPGEANIDHEEIFVERNQEGAVAILNTIIGVGA
ncbi:uncharacterized protein MONOS_6278 [Monocercomonoides exilis]|uniref:uncharacterized protein n=1 Tax=Monocercomonoides exilis TaxID=2049356 RepID=UPI00355A861F|nr:hypothetical protein MONOS_6278 [Monocercomonoides exilis]|eukprot:MONOS_6278.1-p1 / transcript=MONOS_6278.1 / gene=MONOS_6278 / organism=Monocercomonoides_exilis_PA203 / gene_product=unspecified product / transcript_product=unspecified product / location=Mono_scaffold00195:69933-71530(-) / protein_length=512 / sequence_SO=supercontig / SO=protein_coding / is_pseudo=false